MRKREEKRSTEEMNIDVLSRSYNVLVPKEKKALIRALEEEMFELAKNLEFERAAVVRDEIKEDQGNVAHVRGAARSRGRAASSNPMSLASAASYQST